jgi:Macrocin-O-methyltransferase (TylF)
MLYAHLSSILEPYAFNRKIYGFDTFQGFRSLSGNDPGGLNENMFHDADFEVLKGMIEISDGNRALPQITKCEIIKGNAVETIPEFAKNHPELIIALLYLDFDIYEPTRVALEHFLPLVPKGGVVALDELNAHRWAGETIAFKEKPNLSSVKLRKFSFDPWPSYFVVGS